ncbi:MAG: hypothetical protein JWQ98_1849 [Chlorobi bacterium]|jgi:hypothetical protein|nr:hypothetical protein [Chlorobiota bacterium]
MDTTEPINGGSSQFDRPDGPESLFSPYAMMPATPEEFEAYTEGRRNGIISGIVLGSLSGAIMVLVFWLLFH